MPVHAVDRRPLSRLSHCHIRLWREFCVGGSGAKSCLLWRSKRLGCWIHPDFGLPSCRHLGGSDNVRNDKDFFNTLSTYDGRTGPPFTINVALLDYSTYYYYFRDFKLPLFEISWPADFADADNFLRPYMHSDGDFVQYQNYTLENGWNSSHGTNYPSLRKDQLIDLALVTPDGPERAKCTQTWRTFTLTIVQAFRLINHTFADGVNTG